jgi:hypothetical protein
MSERQAEIERIKTALDAAEATSTSSRSLGSVVDREGAFAP